MIIRKANKKRKEEVSKRHSIVPYVVLGTLILFLFLFLQPKIASDIFSFEREGRVSAFLRMVKSEQTIDPQTYWKFREFYSSGHFEFSREGFTKEELSVLPDNLSNAISEQDQPFLIYHSPHLTSIDMLTPSSNLSTFISSLSAGHTLWENSNERIYTLDNGDMVITFLKPFEEMERANGFFDYTNKDRKLDRNLHWLNITVITP